MQGFRALQVGKRLSMIGGVQGRKNTVLRCGGRRGGEGGLEVDQLKTRRSKDQFGQANVFALH